MKSLKAVIEIGSTGIRLLVAETTDNGGRATLDHSETPLPIGHDVFTSGSISRETLSQCIRILLRFKEQLAPWGINPEQTSVIATSAVRESKNRDPFVDQIKVKTGFRVHIIDGIENNRLTYLAVADCMTNIYAANHEQDALILEVGGGSTELMLIEKGKMAGAHSMRLGTVIVEQQLRSILGSIEDTRRYVEEFILNTKYSLDNELDFRRIKEFIAVGADALIAARSTGNQTSPVVWEIQRDDFDAFVEGLQGYTAEECAAKFKIPQADAMSLPINLLVYKLFLNLTSAKKILVADTSIRDGLIIAMHASPNVLMQEDFYTQITASAKNILRKYKGDEQHADYVRKMSLKLYDALESEIALSEKARMLLEVSAILHDIGMFIRADDHNRHSSYIISNSEIFGLNKEDITIISQIALFHRGRQNPQEEQYFKMLSRELRMTISKLTAILRVADALDRSHKQKFPDFSIEINQDTLTIRTSDNPNTALEKLALAQKADLFESIFGYKVLII